MAGGANLAPASIPSNSPLSQNFQFDVIFSLKKGNKFSYFINSRIFLAHRVIREYISELRLLSHNHLRTPHDKIPIGKY